VDHISLLALADGTRKAVGAERRPHGHPITVEHRFDGIDLERAGD
jgi:hypothetical protein